jgi:hypothetical protein
VLVNAFGATRTSVGWLRRASSITTQQRSCSSGAVTSDQVTRGSGDSAPDGCATTLQHPRCMPPRARPTLADRLPASRRAGARSPASAAHARATRRSTGTRPDKPARPRSAPAPPPDHASPAARGQGRRRTTAWADMRGRGPRCSIALHHAVSCRRVGDDSARRTRWRKKIARVAGTSRSHCNSVSRPCRSNHRREVGPQPCVPGALTPS